jgi:DNA-binding GntR family transcriptional regulator
MSRTPVREAALVLETQGLLEVRPRKGVRIQAVSAEDMAEVYEVLTALESVAAERAAEQGHGPEDLAALEAAIAQMDRAIAQDDLAAWADADEAFHRALVRLGGNARIIEIAERMSDQVRRARAVTLHLRPKPVQSNEDHRAVFEAIRRGDAATAGATHRQHRAEAKEMLVGLLRRFGMRRI